VTEKLGHSDIIVVGTTEADDGITRVGIGVEGARVGMEVEAAVGVFARI
jgi:hypothetical protein